MTPEEYAAQLDARIRDLAQHPPPYDNDLYVFAPQPPMILAVAWPQAWLVETIRAAVAAERDRCAQIAASHDKQLWHGSTIAAAIRAAPE